MRCWAIAISGARLFAICPNSELWRLLKGEGGLQCFHLVPSLLFSSFFFSILHFPPPLLSLFFLHSCSMTSIYATDIHVVRPCEDSSSSIMDQSYSSGTSSSSNESLGQQQRQQQQQPTITLSPPPAPSEHRSARRKRSFRNLFAASSSNSDSSEAPIFVSAISRRLSNLSLRSPQTSRPPSPSDTPTTSTVGAAAVAASLAAALAVSQDGKDEMLHPNAAYQSQRFEQPPSPSTSHSTLSSPGTESPTMFTEMKRVLSQYQQIRQFAGGRRRRSSTSKSSIDDDPPPFRAQPLLLHEKYGNLRKGKIVGRGATAVIRLLEVPHENRIVAVKAFRRRDRDETEKDYQKRMTSEFCISKTLRHPHIVETFDLVKDHKDRWCSVMEYVSKKWPTPPRNLLESNNNNNNNLVFYKVLRRGCFHYPARIQSRRFRNRLSVQAALAGSGAYASVRCCAP